MRAQNTVLFIDARGFYRQVNRAIRDFLPEQIEFLANIVRLYRGRLVETEYVGANSFVQTWEKANDHALTYHDIAGVCKVATLAEIEAHGWSLNPGRYVGVANAAQEDFDFAERLEALNEELQTLNIEADELEARITENVSTLLQTL